MFLDPLAHKWLLVGEGLRLVLNKHSYTSVLIFTVGMPSGGDDEYWVNARVEDAEMHKFFLHVKIVFGNNEGSAFYRHVDAALSIKEIKDMIKRKKMAEAAADHPINLRVQIHAMCKLVGASIRDVQNGDGTPTEHAEQKYKEDDKTMKEVLAEYEPNPFLVGHELVDRNVYTKVVLRWST